MLTASIGAESVRLRGVALLQTAKPGVRGGQLGARLALQSAASAACSVEKSHLKVASFAHHALVGSASRYLPELFSRNLCETQFRAHARVKRRQHDSNGRTRFIFSLLTSGSAYRNPRAEMASALEHRPRVRVYRKDYPGVDCRTR